MSRPSLLQSLFSKPSQSYYARQLPVEQQETQQQKPERDLYSAKQQFLQAARECNVTTPFQRRRRPPSPDSDTDDVFYTPNTSPRDSMDGSWVQYTLDDLISKYNEQNGSLVTRPPPHPIASSSDSSESVLSSRNTDSDADLISTFSFSSSASGSTAQTTPNPSLAGSRKKSTFSRAGDLIDKEAFTGAWAGVTSYSTTSSNPDFAQHSLTSYSHATSTSEHRQSASSVSSMSASRSYTSHSTDYSLEIIDVSKSLRHQRRRSAHTSSKRLSSRTEKGKRRMSAVVEEDECDECSLPDGSAARVSTMLSEPEAPASLPTERPRLVITHQTVDLPAPMPLLGVSTSSFNQLVLPRPAYKPSARPSKVESRVDLVSLGIAQTAMCSIEIQKNAAAMASSKRGFSRLNKHVLPGSALEGRTVSPRSALLSPLSFASNLRPPTNVKSHQVIVKVWAVGLDGLDGLIVREKAKKVDGAGFVPGRSFVGRVVESGYAVEDAVRNGDWIYGLTSAQKCGALAEFITIDRRRVHPAPHASSALSLEQIAVIPLTGIPSHRVVSSLASLIRMRGSKILVLESHRGIGLTLCQQLNAYGAVVTSQIPDSGHLQVNSRIVHSAGASHIISGSAASVMADLEESEYDAVVDTIGGKAIWIAAQRILRTAGQFATLVGNTSVVTPSAGHNLRYSLSSLKRTFIKNDIKNLGYSWISTTADCDHAGGDIYETLSTVTSLAEAGILRPRVDDAVSFENAVGAFPSPLLIGEPVPTTAVVRIVT